MTSVIGAVETMMMPNFATVVWRRLDRSGREIASVRNIWNGWLLSGMVEVEHNGGTARMSYVITCSRTWQTRDCDIVGFIGDAPVTARIQRDVAGRWSLGDLEVSKVAGCDDIDLAFSPITNLLPIRRLSLPLGGTAQVSAAWLRFPELTLERLEQTYTHLASNRYLYESADGQFRRELTVDDTGLVLDYPGLWIAEASRANGHFPAAT